MLLFLAMVNSQVEKLPRKGSKDASFL